MCPYVAPPTDPKRPSYAYAPMLGGSVELMDTYGACYGAKEEDAKNYLAWPVLASVDQLRGLPPTVVSLNELDSLRDEGQTRDTL